LALLVWLVVLKQSPLLSVQHLMELQSPVNKNQHPWIEEFENQLETI